MERKTNKQVKEFSKRLLKDFPDAKIILFGSRTGKDYLENSDFDFIIISKKFEGQNFYKRIEKIYDYWPYKQAIEPLCYTPIEFEEKIKQINIVQKAARKGIIIV